MKGTKWLSEAVHMENIRIGSLNIVCGPTGSGKTEWALSQLPERISAPYKMVYLIDTKNGKDQLLQDSRTAFYSDEWRETVQHGIVWFGEAVTGNKIVVMTYAKFGVLAERYPNFGYDFELILCDEIQSLPRFAGFSDKGSFHPHQRAKSQLELIAAYTETEVIAITATPARAIEKMDCPIQLIPVDDDVRQLEIAQTFFYSNKFQLLEELSPLEKGIVYIGHVTAMIDFWNRAKEKGFRAIAIWSTNNTENPMTEEQLQAREYILTQQQLPPQYDMVIINASSETSINIYGTVNYIVVHSQQEETRTQVRGRYRKDLEKLYLLDYSGTVSVPAHYLNRKLFKEEKENLCRALNLRDKNSRLLKWPSIKERLSESGYTVSEKRENNKRYAVLSP